MNTASLRERQCEAKTEELSSSLREELFKQIHPDWNVTEENKNLTRDFTFSNYYETIAFVNAVAWIANTQNHHPDIFLSYNSCRIDWTTHSVRGLSENDFICAARCDAL